jgi:hypothetical protein
MTAAKSPSEDSSDAALSDISWSGQSLPSVNGIARFGLRQAWRAQEEKRQEEKNRLLQEELKRREAEYLSKKEEKYSDDGSALSDVSSFHEEKPCRTTSADSGATTTCEINKYLNGKNQLASSVSDDDSAFSDISKEDEQVEQIELITPVRSNSGNLSRKPSRIATAELRRKDEEYFVQQASWEVRIANRGDSSSSDSEDEEEAYEPPKPSTSLAELVERRRQAQQSAQASAQQTAKDASPKTSQSEHLSNQISPLGAGSGLIAARALRRSVTFAD